MKKYIFFFFKKEKNMNDLYSICVNTIYLFLIIIIYLIFNI